MNRCASWTHQETLGARLDIVGGTESEPLVGNLNSEDDDTITR